MGVERDRFGALVRDLKPVWVRHADGRWYPGVLRQWRRVAGPDGVVWLALVDYYAPGTAEDQGTHWLLEVAADGVELRVGEAKVGVARGDAEEVE